MKDKTKPYKSPKQKSVLDDVPENPQELSRAVDLTKQAATVGFDWSSIAPVFAKMDEEMAELKEAIISGDVANILDELGDVIFVCSNLARHLEIDPCLALKHANDKFENRFRKVEKIVKKRYPQKTFFDLDLLERTWTQVKNLEKE